MKPIEIKVVNNKNFPPVIESSMTELSGNYDFKPHIGLLPSKKLVMFVAHAHAEELSTTEYMDSPRALSSHVVMYTSIDSGITWSRGKHVKELNSGHEPSVSVIDGILYVKIHAFGSGGYPDPYAKRDYPYLVVARSIDEGKTFTTTIFDYDNCYVTNKERIQDSRNIIKRSDGSLYFGIGVGNSHRQVISNDNGMTWKVLKATVLHCSYPNVSRSFFAEGVFFYSTSNRFLLLSRVDYAYANFTKKLPGNKGTMNETFLDNFDGELLLESLDNGKTWQPLQAVGFPALMYPSVVNLEDNNHLLTYTVREIPPKGSGCIHRKVGVQAIIFKELPNGNFFFDFSNDVIILDDCTPDSMRNAGCFGNTLMLDDNTLITPFSYPKIDQDILKIANNKGYLQQEVFDYYANAQTTYDWRYKDFIRKSKELMELHLRRSFSALFLYAGCMNKGGIGTRIIKWKLPKNKITKNL
ncbi:MAG: exo-alpha-sialidase [Clostridiales bacterium]|nr:exo-alpha-sialidase [Clostridiales bacterium]